MKKITIKGEEFYYSVDDGYTFFYKEDKSKSFKTMVVSEFSIEFRMSYNIESVYYSKCDMKILVEKAYDEYVRKKERQSEIDKGEVI